MKNITNITNITGHIADCLAFLSILPIERFLTDSKQAGFSQSAHAFPLAGLLLAMPPACILLLLDTLDVAPPVIAILATLALIITTGALHEDGLADTIDGFFGGKNKQDKLKIMKDSHIGSYGVLALIISVLTRILLLWQIILTLDVFASLLVFIAIAALSRTSILWLWVQQEIADEESESLAQNFGKPDNEHLTIAGIFSLPIIFILLLSCGIIPVLLACSFSALAIWSFGLLCYYNIEGIRGDNLGAAQQICEVVLYLSLVAFL